MARRMADWLHGNAQRVRPARPVQHNVDSTIQHAAVVALNEGDDFIRTMVRRCTESRAIMVEGLSRLNGVTVLAPEGAFYLMVRVDTTETITCNWRRLLREAKVGVAPATGLRNFGRGAVRAVFGCMPSASELAARRWSVALFADGQSTRTGSNPVSPIHSP